MDTFRNTNRRVLPMSQQLKGIVIALVLICFQFLVYAQSEGTLSQKVTIQAENITLDELLKELSNQTSIKFSFNPKKVNISRRVSYQAVDRSLNDVLNDLFTTDYTFKERGVYVVIVPEERTPEQEKNVIYLSGSILDDETNLGLAETSVYTSSGKSAVTDKNGEFEIYVKSHDTPVLEIRKEGFYPSTMQIERMDASELEFRLRPIKHLSVQLNRGTIPPVETKSVKNHEISTMFRIHPELVVNQKNISDTLYKPISFSLYPGIATYGRLSGNIIYNLAINFIGYNRGINGLELGAISNINKENVRGLQAGGLSNYTGGSLEGVQLSGIFNKVEGRTIGTSFSGVLNLGNDTLSGIQMAGVYNSNKTHISGIQCAGVFNASSSVEGLQLSGVMNKSQKTNGLQLSGVFGMSDTLSGLQMAGVTNYSKNINGLQIAGLFNRGRKVKGMQLAVFNSADTLEGVAIGLLSFVKSNGYKRIGMYYDEIFPVNLSFKTGTHQFHNQLFAGSMIDSLDNDNTLWTFGYGVGSAIPLFKRLNIDLDFSGQHITKRQFTSQLSLLLKGYLGLELRLTNSISVAGGVTYNAFVLDNELETDPVFTKLNSEYDKIYLEKNQTWRTWQGYRIGLRFAI